MIKIIDRDAAMGVRSVRRAAAQDVGKELDRAGLQSRGAAAAHRRGRRSDGDVVDQSRAADARSEQQPDRP
ncbi:hypothetical protein, partial [Bosea sp. (in: a-proteobacteria)]|uniref:hypothetical protein n=1 Tax=Bosea sp. (in: a-proteobacteria) TaxID=1871050 RepID=UPI001AD52EAA